MQVKHVIVAAAVVAAGAFGISQVGGGEDVELASTTDETSTTTTAAAAGDAAAVVPVDPASPSTPDDPRAGARASADDTPPTAPAAPAAQPEAEPTPEPEPATTTTAAPAPEPTTSTTAFEGYWCTVSVPATAAAGSSVTATVRSNAPDSTVVIRVGTEGDDREVRQRTDSSGSSSYTFPARAGDSGQVTAWVPWSVGGDPAECSGSYAVS